MQFIFSIIRIYVRNTVPRLYLKNFQQGYGISTAICKAAIAPLLCSRPSTELACPQIWLPFSRNLNLKPCVPSCSMLGNSGGLVLRISKFVSARYYALKFCGCLAPWRPRQCKPLENAPFLQNQKCVKSKQCPK